MLKKKIKVLPFIITDKNDLVIAVTGGVIFKKLSFKFLQNS